MKRILILLIIGLSLSNCDQEEVIVHENNLETLYNDKTISNTELQAKSLAFIYSSNDNKLFGRILMAINKQPKPTIIFLHGNPGFEKNEDIGQALRRGGYNAVFFSYSGTWGNNGVFNYKNSINDLNSIVDYLIVNSKRLRIDKENIYLCGFSMGADIAVITGNKNRNIKGVISIDPWNGFFELNNKNDSDLEKYIRNLEQRPCINIESGAEYVASILDNRNMDLQPILKNYSKPIIHIFSKEKSMNEFKNNCELANQELKVIEASDHSFSDKRIALTNEIALWIKNHNQ